MSDKIICGILSDPYDKHQDVAVGNIKMKRDISVGYQTKRQLKTLTKTDAPTDSFTTAGREINFRINASDVNEIGNLKLRYKIAEGSAASMLLLPTALWNDKIEFIHGQEVFAFIRGDNLYFKQCVLQTAGQYQCSRFLANMGLNYGVSQEQLQKASETKWYEYQFSDNVLELLRVKLSTLKSDMIIKIYPRNGIVVSGSGTPSLSQVDVRIVQSGFHTGKREGIISKNIFGAMFLQPLQYETTATLTAGTKSKISLEDLKSRYVAFLTFQIRSSTYSATSGTILNNYDLGPNSLIDLEETSGVSIYAGGQPVNGDHLLYNEFPHHFNSNFTSHQYIYYMPFCDNGSLAMKGVVNGWMDLVESVKNLAITPDSSANVAEVQTVTMSGTSASGSYFFSFKGFNSDPLAYNANTTSMNTAINAMKIFADNGLTCACSAAATSSFTITISGERIHLLDGDTVKLVPIVLETSAPAVVTATSSRTTVGRRGWTTGSYKITVYAYCYSSVIQKRDMISKA